jgi:hypothetical protein
MRIREPGWKKIGSGIRDKYPGSAALFITVCLKIRKIFEAKALISFQSNKMLAFYDALFFFQKLGEKNPRVERKDGCYALGNVKRQSQTVFT